MNTNILKTPYGFATTAKEIINGVVLNGKNVIITGGASGIGTETTKALALTGANITVAVRRVEAAQEVVDQIIAETGNSNIDIRKLDVSDLNSVAEFVKGYDKPLHILINNAGVMQIPEKQLSAQGYEMQFATNYLGHFALTLGLEENLKAANGARVVSISSSGHLYSPVYFDDINFNFIPYTPLTAYGQSKTAEALLSIGITKKWSEFGVYSNSLNPGAIATGLQKYTGGLKTPEHLRKTPEQGAATTILLAVSPLLEGVGGKYFEDCNESPRVTAAPTDFSGGVAPYVNEENAERLWDMMEEVVREYI